MARARQQIQAGEYTIVVYHNEPLGKLVVTVMGNDKRPVESIRVIKESKLAIKCQPISLN